MAQAAMATKKTFMIRDNNIPSEIKGLDSWLIWRYEDNPKPGKKPLKVPYWVNGRKRYGELGGDKDRARLAPFDDALEAARAAGFDGVGLAIMPEHDLTVLDIDDCISDEGDLSEFAQQVVDTGTYVERSPSGKGLRAVYKGALVPGEKRNFHLENKERVEVYCGAAYTTFTGNKLKGIERDVILDLPRPVKRTLVKGMELSNVSTTTRDADSGGDEGLASMNARPIPNMTPAQALRVLQGLPKHWGASGEGNWFQVAAALHMQFDGSEEGYEVLDQWSRDRDGYDGDANRTRWDAGFSHDRGKQNVRSMRNLVFEAKQSGTKFKQSTLESWGLVREAQEKAAEADIELPDDEVSPDVLAAWTPMALAGLWDAERPKGTPALVEHWMYEETVTLFSSHGGSGKSYVSLTFAAFAACGGKTWYGKQMVQGDVLFVNGEDPKEETMHRLWGIVKKHDLDVTEVEKHLHIVNITTLLHKALYTAGTDYGKTEFTKQYHLLKDLVKRLGCKYVILDNISKFYAANENARPMVDEFVSAFAAIAIEQHLGVLLIGHTAKAGADGYSGSTAWHNSARGRWNLATDDQGNRVLTVDKVNYGKPGHGGTLVWDEEFGVITLGATVGDGAASSEFGDLALEEAVMQAVRDISAAGGHTSTGDSGPLGPITQNPLVLDTCGTDQKLLRSALRSLEKRGLLVRGTYKKRSRKDAEEYLPSDEIDPING